MSSGASRPRRGTTTPPAAARRGVRTSEGCWDSDAGREGRGRERWNARVSKEELSAVKNHTPGQPLPASALHTRVLISISQGNGSDFGGGDRSPARRPDVELFLRPRIFPQGQFETEIIRIEAVIPTMSCGKGDIIENLEESECGEAEQDIYVFWRGYRSARSGRCSPVFHLSFFFHFAVPRFPSLSNLSLQPLSPSRSLFGELFFDCFITFINGPWCRRHSGRFLCWLAIVGLRKDANFNLILSNIIYVCTWSREYRLRDKPRMLFFNCI